MLNIYKEGFVSVIAGDARRDWLAPRGLESVLRKLGERAVDQMPISTLAMMSRWISDVPPKIV
jgi:hypothetical protein